MALVLVSTPPGAANANSYASVAEATTFFEGHLYGSAWTDADAATQAAALVMATRTLDTLVEWSGAVVTSTQALQWPRSGMYYRNRVYPIPNTEVPADLKNAVAEFARQLIVGDRTADNDVEANKLRSLKAGPVELEFDAGVVAKVVPDSVWAMLPEHWGYIRSRSGAGHRELVRA